MCMTASGEPGLVVHVQGQHEQCRRRPRWRPVAAVHDPSCGGAPACSGCTEATEQGRSRRSALASFAAAAAIAAAAGVAPARAGLVSDAARMCGGPTVATLTFHPLCRRTQVYCRYGSDVAPSDLKVLCSMAQILATGGAGGDRHRGSDGRQRCPLRASSARLRIGIMPTLGLCIWSPHDATLECP